MKIALLIAIVVITIGLPILLRRSSLLSVVPRVRHDHDILVAHTGVKGLLLSLTLLYRTVLVDPGSKAVTIKTRLFWLLPLERTIPFKDVEAIIYRYENMNVSSAFGASGDTKDWFKVGLRLKGYDEVHLFNFFGEGSFEHGYLDWWPEWLYWSDRLLDMSGTQEDDSRSYINQLQEILKVGIVN